MRTEEQVLQEFIDFGYKIKKYPNKQIDIIDLSKKNKRMIVANGELYLSAWVFMNMKELSLIHELLQIWGWL